MHTNSKRERKAGEARISNISLNLTKEKEKEKQLCILNLQFTHSGSKIICNSHIQSEHEDQTFDVVHTNKPSAGLPLTTTISTVAWT